MEEREARELRLKRLKRKRMFTMIALVAVLGLLGGGYWFITDRKAKLAAEEAQKKAEQEAARNQKSKITGFLLNDVNEAEFTTEDSSYHFVWVEEGEYGSWVRQGEEDFPTNEEKLQTIIGVFCELEGTSKMLLDDIDPANYGLRDARLTMKLTLTDGTEHSFCIGDKAPYDAGYYLLYENTGEVYVVSSSIHTQLTTKEIKLVQGETFPSAEPESITELRIEVRDGETVSYVPEVAEDGTKTIPPIYYDSVRFVASTVQEYNCTDFAQYGLDNPYVTVTIDYLGYVFTDGGLLTREPCTMKLEIGDKTVSDNYFVRVDESDFVYIMMKAQAKKYLPE
ncbi:MAG: DUF4340 domain-containing protein [Lachnospiraceae bacterium]|nr:DUF4340 domain-containing protein [Lachnospiraceae bacterium]